MLQSFLLVLMLLTWGSLKRSTIFCRFLIDMVPSRRTYWYLKKVTIAIINCDNFWFWRLWSKLWQDMNWWRNHSKTGLCFNLVKRLFSNRWKKTSSVTLGVPHMPLFCSYHILMSSVIYYWSDVWQHGICLLKLNLSSRWLRA